MKPLFRNDPMWRHEHLDVTDSTMERIKALPDAEVPERGFRLLTTGYQTMGHGQKGTRWEADEGRNLLFSFAFRPRQVQANHQFALSEALALAVADALACWIGPCTVKWPNDVYWHDRKIAGMLLEHTLAGSAIAVTRTGVGVNVNQQQFRSDAPNPVSLFQICSQEVDLSSLLERILRSFESNLSLVYDGKERLLHQRYMQHLYWREGLHDFRTLSGEAFQASIADISPLGMLTLNLPGHGERTFAFKEVSFIIPS